MFASSKNFQNWPLNSVIITDDTPSHDATGHRQTETQTLTHISLASFLWDPDPDQTQHVVASDQGIHCLLTECSIKMKNTTQRT